MKRRLKRLTKGRGGLLSAGAAVVLVVVLIVVISSGGGDKKKSKTTATGQPQTGTNTSTTPSPGPVSRSMIDEDKLAPIVAQVKVKIGSLRLIQVTISDTGAQFEYERSGRPGFIVADPNTKRIRSLPTTHLKANAKRSTFRISQLDPAVPAKLRAEAPKIGGGGFHVTSLLLHRDAVSHKITWTVIDADNPRLAQLTAAADGSGLNKAF